MNQDIFKLVGLDEEGGRQESARGVMRLVCRTRDGGKLAIWGSSKNTTNIDLVAEAGFPCTINCYWREPAPWARNRYGHTHWIREDADLEIVSQHFETENEALSGDWSFPIQNRTRKPQAL